MFDNEDEISLFGQNTGEVWLFWVGQKCSKMRGLTFQYKRITMLNLISTPFKNLPTFQINLEV